MPRRRLPEEDHENHERWLVSYADFITLLFAFFVVMYAISTLNEGKYRVLSDALVSAFRHEKLSAPRAVGPPPMKTAQTLPALPARAADPVRRQREQKLVGLASRLTEVMKPLVSSGHVRLTQSSRGLAVEINASVRCASGQVAPEAAQVSGPVGIAREVGNAVTSSIDYGVFWPILRLSAVLSAALAITNLLPLPALDGGRLLFILIETIRGRRVNPEREGFVHMIGFMLLLSLLVFITVRDIASPQQMIDWGTILGQ